MWELLPIVPCKQVDRLVASRFISVGGAGKWGLIFAAVIASSFAEEGKCPHTHTSIVALKVKLYPQKDIAKQSWNFNHTAFV